MTGGPQGAGWTTLSQVARQQCLPEGSQGLEVDGFQHMLRCVQFQQKHDEDAVVWQLLELRLADVVVLNQDTHDYTQNLQGQELQSGVFAFKNLVWK